jgi:hypothetical protein
MRLVVAGGGIAEYVQPAILHIEYPILRDSRPRIEPRFSGEILTDRAVGDLDREYDIAGLRVALELAERPANYGSVGFWLIARVIFGRDIDGCPMNDELSSEDRLQSDDGRAGSLGVLVRLALLVDQLSVSNTSTPARVQVLGVDSLNRAVIGPPNCKVTCHSCRSTAAG